MSRGVCLFMIIIYRFKVMCMKTHATSHKEKPAEVQQGRKNESITYVPADAPLAHRFLRVTSWYIW